MNAVGDFQVGIDSLVTCSAAALANAKSPPFLGRAPVLWGRYIYAPGQINSTGKHDSHYSAAENSFLRSNNIRLLPIARQTGNVGGDADTAIRDAKLNVEALFEAISPNYLAGADPNALVFLDVEESNALSAEYYLAWAQTIADHSSEKSSGHVRLRPAIYAGPTHAETWNALAKAVNQGSVCYGAWMARYFLHGSPIPPAWNDGFVTPTVKMDSPILAWQYWASPDHAPPELNFDTTLINAAHADALLDGLIMPPG
jgi:hypothetical protein